MAKAKVYFSKTITPEKVLEMYETLGRELTGNIAVKVHSGEVDFNPRSPHGERQQKPHIYIKIRVLI